MGQDVEYIIIQAGGKGTRMEKLTRNKPKALVPVNNLPMIMHLFRKYPEKEFIVIGDYKYDVLEKYLRVFADVKYRMVNANGHKGTCAGLADALSHVPENTRFMLIWCDLVLPEQYSIPDSKKNIIGISKDFECRWKYEDDIFKEERSAEFGVAGHFIFMNKTYLKDVPLEGEFVRWLQSRGEVFETQGLYKTHEYGLYSEWSKLPQTQCRPFNRIMIEDNRIYKVPIDEQGKALAKREVAWYQKIEGMRFKYIPEIYGYEPLCMERIHGKNVYEYSHISKERKAFVLNQIISCLKKVHEIDSITVDVDSYRIAYIDKTFDRLEKVRNLIPFANKKTLTINGKSCRNVFFSRDRLEQLVMKFVPSEFRLIHGDCTFSNMLLKDDMTPMLIDPRGYFGRTELYGDAAYDWVKLFYSLFSNYDQFNLKRFDLYINKDNISISINSNGWEDMEECYFELLKDEISKEQMMLFLAITWLSLTTYTWEDYDSICAAFYIGLYYLEDVL